MSDVRSVPAALQAHLNGSATTTCYLLRIAPKAPGFAVVGATSLDRDVVYDDGAGAVTYSAAIGMVPANFQSTSIMAVDNTEIQHLIPEYGMPITEADVARGAYDFAAYSIYLINYEDPGMGHVLIATGELGQMSIEAGIQFWSEATSLTKRLKQSIVQKDSLTCRATFGSQPIGTSGADITERFPCGKALTWAGPFGVSVVGLENSRSFTSAALTAPAGTYTPGMLEWLTGDNAGRQIEVETQEAGGVVGLGFETMFPIRVGDTFRIRRDCTKWKDGANGCKEHWGAEWVLHYRGEPHIPVSDGNSVNTPGVSVGTGSAG
ncbi:DUF2163 domain-containing protein [Pseudacidovorax intermedius]|uniref:DUF2163 domain-containing protein n=1 Tax=Pseudacidovorax intermedius TaxID=433924 RepID=UPI0026F09D13|nr:DUF2163 domain-containing protein [Pseudacidovorax intermedius]